MSGLRRLLAYLEPYRVLLALALVTAAGASLLDGFSFALLIPFLRLLFGMGAALPEAPTVVERVLAALTGSLLEPTDPAAALVAVAVLLLAAILLKNAGVYVSGFLAIAVRERVVRDLRVAVYEHLHQLALPFYGRMPGGQLVARVLSDTERAGHVVSRSLLTGLRNLGLVLVYLAILFALRASLAALILVLAPILALILRPLLRRVRRRARAAADLGGDIAAVVAETAAGARVVKTHAAEEEESHRFRQAADEQVRHVLGAERLAVLASPLSEVLGAVVLVVLLIAGGVGVDRTATGMRPEVFVAFVAVALRLLSPVKAVTQFPALAAEALGALERVFEVLDLPPDDVDPPDAAPFPGVAREIRFEHVWFAYEPDRWVLRDVSFSIAKGEVVAVVGASGAGKSTLVDLVPRLMDPTRGRVLVDGVALTGYARRSIRRALGIVGQETVLFNDTVRANISYGMDDASDAAVEAAARAANAHEFILRLPSGYDTRVGERGTRLSGGERQRIAIARALLRDPPLLILDEATSSLDPEAEQLVQEAIDRLLEDRTVLVVAHRRSTLRRADRVLVLAEGRIRERTVHGYRHQGVTA